MRWNDRKFLDGFMCTKRMNLVKSFPLASFALVPARVSLAERGLSLVPRYLVLCTHTILISSI